MNKRDAIKLYPGLIQDKYIQEKMKDKFRTERKKACGNKLILKDSLYSYICPDLYAFCEWLFCSIENPKGIIPKNYVYNSFYNDKDYDRVDCLRSPHLYMEHGIRNLVKGAELEMCKEWFHGCDTIVSSHDLLCRILMFDVDGDEVLLTPNGEQLESAQYLINKYSKEIEYLNGEYTKGTITVEEYNEKMQDLNDKQWESVDAYNAAKKAIIELRKKGIDEEIDALEELYDARKKAWEQEKDRHDWEKTVSENETNINKLKAQIAELQNDNSLAGIKKRKELEDELKKTESDWEDTLYDHVYDERQDQLDKELDDKKKALEKTLDDEEQLVADSIELVNKNSTTILDNLNRLSREYGIQMSNSLTEPFTHGENALSHYSTMFSEGNSAFTDQLNYTAMGIYQLQLDADNAAVSVVNMFNSANGTLLEQLSLVRQSLQEITDKANEAANAVRNAGVATPTTTTTTASNSTSSTNCSLGDMAHDTSGTTLPNAGTWKNVQNDIEKAKKDLETIEKQKKVGLVKNTPNKFTTISRGYASGTQSATKGLHPIYEDGVEIIEKDGCLIYPIGAFDGGEKVFNNEQTQRLWELSQNPDVMEKFRQELLNIKPCIDFKFGNTAPVTKTNQNVNVQQHFDALVKVEGDMTPSVYEQLVNDKRIERLMKDWSMEEAVDSINTRGYKIGRIR